MVPPRVGGLEGGALTERGLHVSADGKRASTVFTDRLLLFVLTKPSSVLPLRRLPAGDWCAGLPPVPSP